MSTKATFSDIETSRGRRRTAIRMWLVTFAGMVAMGVVWAGLDWIGSQVAHNLMVWREISPLCGMLALGVVMGVGLGRGASPIRTSADDDPDAYARRTLLH